MRVLVTGATGFVGRATVSYLIGQGHEVVALTTLSKLDDLQGVKESLGEGVRVLVFHGNRDDLRAQLEIVDVVVNLAGNTLAGVRWTDKKKRNFKNSRVGFTQIISEEINNCDTPPSLLISASAVGYYGDCGSEILSDIAEKGTGYLADLCDEWERSALLCSSENTRVCILRLGVVLGREGGILSRISSSFDLGVGTFIGNGQQFVPWIHLVDVVRIVGYCIDTENIKGAMNCTAPVPVTSKDIAMQVKRFTFCKFIVSVPAFIVRLVFGEGVTVLTNSQNATPDLLINHGFEFSFVQLEQALKQEYGHPNLMVRHPNIATRRVDGTFQIRSEVALKREIGEVFPFFASPLNLGLLTPSWLRFRIASMPEEMAVEARIRYSIRLWMVSINWTTRIVEWRQELSVPTFTDVQERGPYSMWCHQHSFWPQQDGTVIMMDTVTYRMPYGVVGHWVHTFFLQNILWRIYSFRAMVIRLRFNSVD